MAASPQGVKAPSETTSPSSPHRATLCTVASHRARLQSRVERNGSSSSPSIVFSRFDKTLPDPVPELVLAGGAGRHSPRSSPRSRHARGHRLAVVTTHTRCGTQLKQACVANALGAVE